MERTQDEVFVENLQLIDSFQSTLLRNVQSKPWIVLEDWNLLDGFSRILPICHVHSCFSTNVHWNSSFKIGSIVASLDNTSAAWHFLQAFEGITITTKFISFPLWKLAMWGFRVENLTSCPLTRFQAPCYAVGTDFSNGGEQNIEKYAPKKQTSPPLIEKRFGQVSKHNTRFRKMQLYSSARIWS